MPANGKRPRGVPDGPNRRHLIPVVRKSYPHWLAWLTSAWILLELLSLRLNLLRRFFFDTAHADVQGIDYFSLPKAWLNIAAHHSLYGTFDPPAYGPHITWYLSHPLLAVLLGWPLSRLAPEDSYGAFTLISLLTMAVSAAVLARESQDPLKRTIIWLLVLGAFPTYLMLWVGNVQAFPVLGLSLLLVGMLRHQREEKRAGSYLVAGLLISLFTKPVVLLMLPLLLLLRETRRFALWALAVYSSVSALLLVSSPLNPESVGVRRVVWLAVHPTFVRRTMDIYANGFRLTPDMRDNSVHWFNLLAQSGFRLQHIDVYSLPVFLDGILGRRTPDWLYLLPTVLVLGLSVMVPRIRDTALRLDAALLLAAAASLCFFLTYPTVWEYQYTAVLPVAAVMLLPGRLVLLGRARMGCFVLACCAWLPSLYFLSGSAAPSPGTITMVRADRVLPVTGLFVLLCFSIVKAVRRPSAVSQPAVSASAAA